MNPFFSEYEINIINNEERKQNLKTQMQNNKKITNNKNLINNLSDPQNKYCTSTSDSILNQQLLSYNSEEEMFNLIHEMRKRVFTSDAFSSDKILGAILFYKTMMSKVDDEYTADYLWNEKHIVSFLKVDKGLKEQENGVKLMKDIPGLVDTLKVAKSKLEPLDDKRD